MKRDVLEQLEVGVLELMANARFEQRNVAGIEASKHGLEAEL